MVKVSTLGSDAQHGFTETSPAFGGEGRRHGSRRVGDADMATGPLELEKFEEEEKDVMVEEASDLQRVIKPSSFLNFKLD